MRAGPADAIRSARSTLRGAQRRQRQQQVLGDYHRDGVAVVRSFAAPDTTEAMMEAMAQLIAAWVPQSSRHSVFHVNSAEGAAVRCMWIAGGSSTRRWSADWALP